MKHTSVFIGICIDRHAAVKPFENYALTFPCSTSQFSEGKPSHRGVRALLGASLCFSNCFHAPVFHVQRGNQLSVLKNRHGMQFRPSPAYSASQLAINHLQGLKWHKRGNWTSFQQANQNPLQLPDISLISIKVALTASSTTGPSVSPGGHY